MVTNIYFVRHANSSYTPDEISRPLSEQGKKDAQKVIELLLHENINKVISSPYKRAIQTVEGLASHFGLSISIDEGFRERKLSDRSVINFEVAILKYWHFLYVLADFVKKGILSKTPQGYRIEKPDELRKIEWDKKTDVR